MASWSMLHLSDRSLLQETSEYATQERTTTAGLLARLAELEERNLFAPAGYPSMLAYCVGELCMSEDMALMRIRVARAARRFPALFDAVADGRLSLTAALLVAPHLTSETTDELLRATAGKTKDEIRMLLAERHPRPDLPTFVREVNASNASGALVPLPASAPNLQLGLDPVVPSGESRSPVQMEPLSPRARIAPLSPGRFALQFTVDQATHDKLRYAQALLGHALPSGDVANVIDRALDALVERLEKQKFAKCARSRPQRGAANGRHVPAAVRRAVWERDGGQCTFVSEKGKRCEARRRLEYDHVEPVARGGQATVGGMRLLCRAHNQHAADRTLGREFMEGKRQQARERAAKAQAEAEASALAKEQERAQAAAEAASQQEVVPWLRALGCNVEAARTAAARCAGMVGAPLEKRVFVACQGLGPHGTKRALPVASSPA